MKTKKLIRKYNFTDAVLAQKCDLALLLSVRDRSHFIHFNMTDTWFGTFQADTNAFKELATDEEMEGIKMEKNAEKEAVRQLLLSAINAVRDRIRIVYGIDSAVYRGIRVGQVTKLSDAELIRLATRVISIGNLKMEKLAEVGLSPAMIAAIRTAITNFDDMIEIVENSVMNRDEKTEERINTGNALYEKLTIISEMGRSIWRETSEALYNDYLIYDQASGGNTKD